MKREPLFSQSGFYGFLLGCNVLLHRQAAAVAIATLRPLLDAAPPTPVSVLDLACGGWPSTIAEVMGAFSAAEFHYWGVDINPDQVAQAQGRFRFPANVTRRRILEGNAWDPESLGLPDDFTVIYSGMNLHHGTPEELWFLAGELHHLLARSGWFLSHDVYRPADSPYRRRPAVNPRPPGESWRMVAAERLAQTEALPIKVLEDRDREEPFWRRDYLDRMQRALLDYGASPEEVADTVGHMGQRDYPVSVEELRQLFRGQRLALAEQPYDGSDDPMAPYVAICVARRMD